MKRKIVALYITSVILSGQGSLFAQTNLKKFSNDTTSLAPISTWKNIQKRTDKVITSKAFQMTYIGVPLIVGGLIVKGEDNRFRNLRNSYIPSFNYHYDDYLQYAPAVAMLGLKIAGVQGRSSWLRMLVSDAFSSGVMAIAVNSIKQTANVTRPDGSNKHSFPSGHTATAFMTATMLHKEYGLTISPWYSIGGYSIATATAMSRMMNNKHWLSDVMVGAGIGILSTELGYLLADLIFKNKGLTHDLIDASNYNYKRDPSFFGAYMGISIMSTRFDITPDLALKASPGSTAGIEGAWFINRHIGVGGRLSATSMPLSLTSLPGNSIINGVSYQLEKLKSKPLNTGDIYVGPYFSYPITDRFLVGSKLLIGCTFINSNAISALIKETESDLPLEKELVNVDHAFSIGYNTSASFSYIIKPNLSVKVFFDYKIIPTRFVSKILDKTEETDHYELRKTLQPMTLGVSVNMMLW